MASFSSAFCFVSGLIQSRPADGVAHRREEVRHHLLHARLGLGREVALHVALPSASPSRAIGRLHAQRFQRGFISFEPRGTGCRTRSSRLTIGSESDRRGAAETFHFRYVFQSASGVVVSCLSTCAMNAGSFDVEVGRRDAGLVENRPSSRSAASSSAARRAGSCGRSPSDRAARRCRVTSWRAATRSRRPSVARLLRIGSVTSRPARTSSPHARDTSRASPRNASLPRVVIAIGQPEAGGEDRGDHVGRGCDCPGLIPIPNGADTLSD